MGDDPEGNVAHHFTGALVVAPGRQEPRTVCLLLKNGARIFQGYKLGLTPVCIVLQLSLQGYSRRISVLALRHLSTAYWLVDDQVHFDHRDT